FPGLGDDGERGASLGEQLRIGRCGSGTDGEGERNRRFLWHATAVIAFQPGGGALQGNGVAGLGGGGHGERNEDDGVAFINEIINNALAKENWRGPLPGAESDVGGVFP